MVQALIGVTSAGKSQHGAIGYIDAHYKNACKNKSIDPDSDSNEAYEIRAKVFDEQRKVLEKCGMHNIKCGFTSWVKKDDDEEEDVLAATEDSTGVQITRRDLYVEELIDCIDHLPEPGFIANNGKVLTDKDIKEIVVKKLEGCKSKLIYDVDVEVGGQVPHALATRTIEDMIEGTSDKLSGLYRYNVNTAPVQYSLHELENMMSRTQNIFSQLGQLAEDLGDYANKRLCSVSIQPVLNVFDLYHASPLIPGTLIGFQRTYHALKDKIFPFVEGENFLPMLWTQFDKIKHVNYQEVYKTLQNKFDSIIPWEDKSIYFNKGALVTYAGTLEGESFKNTGGILRRTILTDAEAIANMTNDGIKNYRGGMIGILRGLKERIRHSQTYKPPELPKVFRGPFACDVNSFSFE